MYDHLKVDYGAKLHTYRSPTGLKINDMSIVPNISVPHPNLNGNHSVFSSFMPANEYAYPYTRRGQLIYFLDAYNPTQKLASVNQNPPYLSQVTCEETSFLTISDESIPLYTKYKTVITIPQIQIQRVSDEEVSSLQQLTIPDISIKRYKMNRITINLIPPASKQ